MADRYVIPAGGNSSDPNTWSATDGGAGGAGVPTSADNAYLSNLSGNLVVDASLPCLDFDCTKGTGYAGTLSGAGALNIFGNLAKLNGAMTFTHTGQVNVFGTAAVFTSNGKTLGGVFSVGSAGGSSCTFADAFNSTAAITINGTATLNTNGMAVTCSVFSNSSGTPTITLGSTVFTCTQWAIIAAATFSGASSTLNITGSAFTTGGKTYGTINLSAVASTVVVTGAITCTTLTRTSGANKVSFLLLDSNVTVSGTFTATGDSAVNRLFVQSSVTGATRTITAGLSNANSNTDFQDIAGAGAGAPFTGTSLGDALGNSGITFTTPATQYWKTTTSGTKPWSTAANWFLGPNGTGGAGRVPLPQDNVVFDANAVVASTTVQIDMPRVGKDIDFSAIVGLNTLTSLGSTQMSFFGSWTMGAGVASWSVGSGGILYWEGRSSHAFTSAGRFNFMGLIIKGLGGTLTLGDALNTGIFWHQAGTFDSGGFSMLTAYYLTSSSLAKTLNLGASTWTINGNDSGGSTNTYAGNGANLTVNAGSSTIRLTDTTTIAKTFNGNGKTFNVVEFTGAGRFIIIGANTFTTLRNRVAGSVTQFPASTTQTATTFDIGGQAATAGDVKRGLLFGLSGAYFSAPDMGGFPTGASAYVADIAADDYTPATPTILFSKWLDTGNQRSVFLDISAAGNPRFSFSTDGTLANSATLTSSAPTGVTDGARKKLGVTMESDGGGGTNVKFWLSDDGAAWTQLGTTQNSALPPTVFNSTAEFRIGQRADAPTNLFIGAVYRVYMTAGALNDAKVVDFNPDLHSSGATFASGGDTYTLNGNATVAYTNHVAICSATAASHTLAKAGGGEVDLRYVSLARSTASPASTFAAHVATDAGNNSQWSFVPTRFYVGGSGNWSDTTRWSLTTGGAGGASVPSVNEDVEFDGNSNATAYTVTMDATSACKDLNFGRAPATSGTVTFAGTQNLTVNGNINMLSGMTNSRNGQTTMNGSAVRTITSNGVVFAGSMTFNGTGTYRLLDAFAQNCTVDNGTFRMLSGTFDPNGFGVTITRQTAGQTIAGAFTFANLTINNTAIKNAGLSLTANIVVTGTFTVTSNSAINRLLIGSDVQGSARTITAAAVSLSNVDFMDIAAAGAIPWTGTLLGDCLGNSGITMEPSVTQTATGTASFTWSTHGWTTRVPLPQDDVVIPNAFSPAGRVISIDMPRLGRNVTFTCTGNPTFAPSLTTTVFGSLTMAPGMVESGTATLTMAARSAVTLTSAGYPFNRAIIAGGPGGTVTLQDALSTASNLQFDDGTFNANDFSVTALNVRMDVTLRNKTVNMGSGTWTLTGDSNTFGGPWIAASTATINCGTSTIRLTNTGSVAKAFVGRAKTYSTVEFVGTGRFIVRDSNTFTTLRNNVAGSAMQIFSGTAQTVTNFEVNGAAPGGSDTKIGRFFGVSGAYFSTPDSAANSVTGDIDIRVCAALEDWTAVATHILLAKLQTGTTRSYFMQMTGGGQIQLATSSDGTFGTQVAAASTVGVPAADGAPLWLRATLDVDNGAGNREYKFYTSTDPQNTDPDLVVWTQLGITVGAVGTTSIFDSNSVVEVGGAFLGTTAPVSGVIYRAAVYNGIGGTKVLDFNPNDYAGGGASTWVSSATGETWTKSGNVIVTATNLVAICSEIAASHTLTKSGGGRVQCNYVSVDRSTASPASTFYAANSINGGNNVNWTFGAFMDCDAGAYVLNGQSADLIANRYLALEAGAYVIAGQDTALDHDFPEFREVVLARVPDDRPVLVSNRA